MIPLRVFDGVSLLVTALINDAREERKLINDHGTADQRKRYIESIIKREENMARNLDWWQARFDEWGDVLDGENA